MSLCWDVFLKDVCKELGLVSPNAQEYARKGSDHHKIWEILEICYIVFTDEILYQFYKYCKYSTMSVTCDNYWLFSSNLKNQNFVFILQMVLTFLHGLMLLRKGTRANKYEYIYAGKNKLALLFLGEIILTITFLLHRRRK